MSRILYMAVLALGVSYLSTEAEASLTSSFQFNGMGNWSIDACGSTSTSPVCSISAEVPTGSTIVQAFLYSSTFGSSAVPTVDFDGTALSGADWTALGVTGPGLQAFRADVTSLVAAKIGGGSGVPFSFDINSETGSVDGELLAIVYSNPAEIERTIAFLDGASATTGDSFAVNLAAPLDTTTAGFEALLSLGIGFGFQPSGQVSQIDVNGRRLTSCAGGQDDGAGANGALITGGGIGDSTDNPDPFCTTAGGPRSDDELYNLALGNSADATAFLLDGITTIDVDTLNPSNDDNIFFAGFNITAEAGVNQPPPNQVPLPSTLALLGSGILGLFLYRRRRT